MARQHNFGWTTVTKEGKIWGAHAWPIELFRGHFQGFTDSQEDWKAAVYKWGGPKPSLIEATDIQFDQENGCVLVMWIEKKQ